MRLRGVSATIREVFPVEYTDLAVFVTEFGGTSVLMVIVALLLWLTQRRESALVVSYAVAGVAFIVGAKSDAKAERLMTLIEQKLSKEPTATPEEQNSEAPN